MNEWDGVTITAPLALEIHNPTSLGIDRQNESESFSTNSVAAAYRTRT